MSYKNRMFDGSLGDSPREFDVISAAYQAPHAGPEGPPAGARYAPHAQHRDSMPEGHHSLSGHKHALVYAPRALVAQLRPQQGVGPPRLAPEVLQSILSHAENLAAAGPSGDAAAGLFLGPLTPIVISKPQGNPLAPLGETRME